MLAASNSEHQLAMKAAYSGSRCQQPLPSAESSDMHQGGSSMQSLGFHSRFHSMFTEVPTAEAAPPVSSAQQQRALWVHSGHPACQQPRQRDIKCLQSGSSGRRAPRLPRRPLQNPRSWTPGLPLY
ncbi:hypothetical protein ABPG77_010047 [Micractinium sp. CCAP 211/92]